ncbi:TonB-dependent receptor [Tsuneonella sp. HG222]
MLKCAAGRAGFVRAFLLSGSAFVAFQGSSAAAQDAASPADDYTAEEDSAIGNEILVTATKREQTLQDVPVAVTVTTAETLERAQIRDLKDLQTVVPSLVVGQRQNLGSTNFFIRGFGNGANNAGIEPSVGVFVDGVFRSRTASQITELPDVQRIEVLRGPQSTLFGKNASAGVISISTAKPAFDLGGSAELTIGNYDLMVGKAYVTGPISENVAFSLAGGISKRDGFFKDGRTLDRTNERDRWFTRGQLLFEGDSGLSVRLIADYDKIDENCCGVVNLQSGPTFAVVTALGGKTNPTNDPFSRVVYNNFNSQNRVKNYGVSGQVDFEVGPGTLTSISAWRYSRNNALQDPDFTSADLVYPFLQDTTVKTITQELRWTGEIGDRINLLLGGFFLKDDVKLKGQLLFGSQFRAYANALIQGLSGGALNVATLEQTFGALEGNPAKYAGQFGQQGRGLTENFDLDSQSLSVFGQVDFEVIDGLTLTLGGNYTDDSKKFRTDTVSTDTFSAINLDAPQYAPFRNTLLRQGAIAQTVGTQLGLGRSATTAEVTAFASGTSPAGPAGAAAFPTIVAGATAFANANQNNPLANPLGGLRAYQFLPPYLNVPNAVEPGRTDDSNFSYTARLAYDIGNTLNVYASYATGFKASSINLSRDARPTAADRVAAIAAGIAPNNLSAGSRFAGPEDARVIEAGLKYNGGGLSANLAVFDQEIEGFQSNLFTGTGFALLNAGKQSTFGVEVETQANINALTLNFAATYLDPKYDSFNNSAVGNLTGTRPAGIAKWTVVTGAQYEADLGNVLVIPRVSYLWSSRTKVVEGLPGFLVRGADGSIVNAAPAIAAAEPFTVERNDLTASIDFEMQNGLTIGFWGRNLLKDNNIEQIFDSVVQNGGISGYINDPRTYGVTARFKW